VKRQVRKRFWIELILAVVNITLLALTAVWTEWIELVFGVEPDAGSGELEWAIAAVTLGLTVAFFMLARMEWRRAAIQVS
jgi:hypothetical protein